MTQPSNTGRYQEGDKLVKRTQIFAWPQEEIEGLLLSVLETQGVTVDAALGIYWDPNSDCLCLKVASPNFAPVEEGMPAPRAGFSVNKDAK